MFPPAPFACGLSDRCSSSPPAAAADEKLHHRTAAAASSERSYCLASSLQYDIIATGGRQRYIYTDLGKIIIIIIYKRKSTDITISIL